MSKQDVALGGINLVGVVGKQGSKTRAGGAQLLRLLLRQGKAHLLRKKVGEQKEMDRSHRVVQGDLFEAGGKSTRQIQPAFFQHPAAVGHPAARIVVAADGKHRDADLFGQGGEDVVEQLHRICGGQRAVIQVAAD